VLRIEAHFGKVAARLTLVVGRLAIVIKAVEILEHMYYNFC